MLLLTVITALSIGGIWSSVSVTQSDVARAGDITVVASNDSEAVVGVDPVSTIQENASSEAFADIHNRAGDRATFTVTLAGDAQNHVSFVSTTGVTVSNDRSVATVEIADGDSTTLLVDVDPNASTALETADFSITGQTSDAQITIDIGTQTGPDVTAA